MPTDFLSFLEQELEQDHTLTPALRQHIMEFARAQELPQHSNEEAAHQHEQQ